MNLSQITRVTEQPLRCSIDHGQPANTPLRDYRDPIVEPAAGSPPAHLRPGGGPLAEQARVIQRHERARVLEQIYKMDLEVFDRLFLDFYKDDAELVNELRGRAYAHAVLFLRELAGVKR